MPALALFGINTFFESQAIFTSFLVYSFHCSFLYLCYLILILVVLAVISEPLQLGLRFYRFDTVLPECYNIKAVLSVAAL